MFSKILWIFVRQTKIAILGQFSKFLQFFFFMGPHFVEFTFAFDNIIIGPEMTEIWSKYVVQAFLPPRQESSAQRLPRDRVNSLYTSLTLFESLWLSLIVFDSVLLCLTLSSLSLFYLIMFDLFDFSSFSLLLFNSIELCFHFLESVKLCLTHAAMHKFWPCFFVPTLIRSG